VSADALGEQVDWQKAQEKVELQTQSADFCPWDLVDVPIEAITSAANSGPVPVDLLYCDFCHRWAGSLRS
jgi:hypothetical protein